MAARFGAFEILYELKSGGMGAVLLARKRGPGTFEQLVAIKTIRAEYASTPTVRAMFLDEAAILARLAHPAVAKVYDFGEDGGVLYMVMEYVAGIPFRDLVDMKPPPTVAARALAEASRGLHAAHEARDIAGHLMGLVHRDISPDNLLLGFDGHVKVIDFGIALVKNRQAPVTEFGTVKGKPPYMSPEQVKNESMDRRSDVFSLGVVAWELLTGQGLFEGDSIYAIAIAVEQQEIVPPSKVIGRPLPAGLDAAIMSALERDPERRTPTAAAFAEQLEQVLQAAMGESLEAWTERELELRRTGHRGWLADIVTGANQLPKATGRPTAQLTEIGPMSAALARTDAALVPPIGATADPKVSTSIGGAADDDDLDRPPTSRRLAPIAIVLVLLLLAGGGAVLFATRDHGVAPKSDARLVTVTADAPLIVQIPIDSASVVETPQDAGEPEDATVPIDAGGHHHSHARDAGIARTVAVDAAVAQRPSGSGLVDVKFKPGTYANISIDGGNSMPGPLFKQHVTAGSHTIRYLDPKSGEVLDTQTIEMTDGGHLVVIQH